MSIIVFGKSPATEHRWVLRPGQRARVGRSPWAEFCMEEDDQLLDFHCELAIENDDHTRVSAIDQAAISVDHSWTQTERDREELHIIAGSSKLILSRRLSSSSSVNKVLTAPNSTGQGTAVEQLPSIELLREIGMSESALQMIDRQHPATSAQALVDHKLDDDALRYVTACLPVPQRLHWCQEQLQHAGHVPHANVGPVVQRWLAAPSESLRQEIGQHIDWNRKQDPLTWFLAAIGWTGGSLSSGNSVPVPPTDQMIISAVITALNLAAAQREFSTFQRTTIEHGIQWLCRLSRK